MRNYYFTYWIWRYGPDAFKNLADEICKNVTVPIEVIKKVGKDDFITQYCIVVYNIVALSYFGLNPTQIAFMLDLSMTPGTSKAFIPSEILAIQKEVIPKIEYYIKKDLNHYKNREV